MGHEQNLYYALGEVAYAIAKTDGIVQKKEKEKLNHILLEEFNKQPLDLDSTAIVSHIVEKDRMDSAIACNWAIKEIKLNSHFVSKKMKEHFVHVLQRVTEEFPPVTAKDQFLIDHFINEIKTMKGDSVFTKE